MKKITYFTILILMYSSIASTQSVLNYQTGTGVVVLPGADICADKVQINGTFSGGGTICGGTPVVLNLNAFIQGFYRTASHTMIADTVTVYLRSAVLPYVKVDSAKSVLSTSGMASLIYFNAVNGTNYYVVVKHRNSIETWSSSGVAFSSGTLTYNFTPSAGNAFGNNQIQVDAALVRFGIYSGDVT